MPPRPCITPDCPRQAGVPGAARDRCPSCYVQYRKSPEYERKGAPNKPRTNLADRFWSYVDRTDPAGCWLWTGSTSSRGYGQIRVQQKNLSTHRVAWMLAHEGTLTPEDVICHRCDTPLCCRPDHLFKGTFAVNSADMTNKERQAKGRVLWSAKLTPDQVEEIRARYRAGGIRQKDLGHEYGISQAHVSSLVRGKYWH